MQFLISDQYTIIHYMPYIILYIIGVIGGIWCWTTWQCAKDSSKKLL